MKSLDFDLPDSYNKILEHAVFFKLLVRKESRLLKFRKVSIVFVSFFLLGVAFANGSAAQTHKMRILFVGNSLTSANDLPGMVAQLARSRHVDIECDMSAPAGYTFAQHVADPALLQKISQGAWDVVVLQEQSQMPALSQTFVAQYVYPYAQQLSELVRKANPQARIVFYMTMAKKNGDRQEISGRAELVTYDKMQRRINGSYAFMAQHNSALLAPVGVAWRNVRSESRMELYADEKHPNLLGTYLAACVIYKVIFKDALVGIFHPSSIDDGSAVYLQRMAEKSVLQTP